ncbi:RNA-directed DNA polymerase from mobile element jockey [Trichonephila clavipes]|uniref:RNA-directed DNA polymerase from mobile element jockey n=1 Tax=Trichonephila clavipes TaxID=2585209 RepID=A0A8X6VBU6_TRICX|nr:RNA-directed DNA polymerase from mobile element jockey [Trichonephila clavipes]
MQRYLDILVNWLTDWRIAINVEKTQAIVFRKWGVIDPQAELTLFDDNIHWVPVVRYLGLHIDGRLAYKKHIDYLSDKFWGRIALAVSLIGRSSPLSLENKVILYKQILRPTITTGISVKAGSIFVPPAVASVSFSLQTLFFFIPAAKKKSSILLPTAFLVLLERVLGLLSPPFLRSSILALVTSLQFRPRSAALFLQPPPAGGMISDIGLSFHLFLRDSGYKRFISLAPTSSNFRFVSDSALHPVRFF